MYKQCIFLRMYRNDIGFGFFRHCIQTMVCGANDDGFPIDNCQVSQRRGCNVLNTCGPATNIRNAEVTRAADMYLAIFIQEQSGQVLVCNLYDVGEACCIEAIAIVFTPCNDCAVIFESISDLVGCGDLAYSIRCFYRYIDLPFGIVTPTENGPAGS